MKILMIDDDKDAVEPIIDALVEHGGHNVTKVSTIKEAEAEFASDSWRYDLFIIDVQIKPAPSEKTTEEESLVAGLILLRKFRARFEKEKVLILTNNLHRVPTALWSGNPNTRARDKVDVRGRRILDVVSW